jgi:DNA-binding NarL/FixJ family response regulator
VSENRWRDVAEEALRTGAGGYVVKSDAGSELLPAVEAVLEGKRLLAPVWVVTISTTLPSRRLEKLIATQSLHLPHS